ncbi:MAG: hypothetical protein IK990_21230 [Ruminiclostridium sp.]|nr:hypothetical protein [Ruminiclostridium sp.]
MKKGNSPLVNGFILSAICVYLIWYFSANGMWNPATVVIMIIMVLLSAGQFIIWYMFFREPKKKKRK